MEEGLRTNRSTALFEGVELAGGLQPNSDGLQPTSDGLQPTSDGLHPRSTYMLIIVLP